MQTDSKRGKHTIHLKSPLNTFDQVCVDAERTDCELVTVTKCFDVPEEQCENVCEDVYWCKKCNTDP